MFAALGRLTYRFRVAILVLAAAFLAGGGLWGGQVIGDLKPGGFSDPGSESAHAERVLDDRIGRDATDVVLLYRSDTETVDDPAYRAAVRRTVARLPGDVVSSAATYWSTGAAQFVSRDRHATYVALRLTAATDGGRMDQVERLRPDLGARGLRLTVGGPAAVDRDASAQVVTDLERAEGLSLPVVFVLLVVVFGGLVAASLPLAVGITAIVGAFVVVRLVSFGTDVSIFSINSITLLGFGLAIDYGLFVVSRYREELAAGHDVPAAIERATATAGRTVAVSGITVAVAVAGLTLFPVMFLRSMGIGGTAAVLVAAVAALVVLPALLGVLGRRVDALSLRPLARRLVPARWQRRRARPGDRGAWAGLARSVMRRPVAYAVGVAALLVALGLPFLGVSFGGIDQRVLPPGAPSRVVAETIDADFPDQQPYPVAVAVRLDGPATGPTQRAALAAYLDRVRDVPGVTGARVTGADGDLVRVSADFAGEAASAPARHVVARVRDVAPPPGGTVRVGGVSADLVDLLASLRRILPWLALVAGGASFVLLFLAFGSLVVPLKAIVMNVLSLGATFGVLVWGFQDGHLAGLLRFTPTGDLDATQPVLVLAVAFGLSMDYEVFLLSRIREQYDRTGDNAAAVASGLQRTGRIVTSAALLLVVVIAAFSTSEITFIKLIGVGMAVAVVVDATLVRCLLVPATMRLLGRANWWAPGPLRRLWERFGRHESGAVHADAGAPDTVRRAPDGVQNDPAVGSR